MSLGESVKENGRAPLVMGGSSRVSTKLSLGMRSSFTPYLTLVECGLNLIYRKMDSSMDLIDEAKNTTQ
jgi:hypothetical protein